jgi:hypothetical protein
MKGVYFVNAKDAAKGESHNASSMRSLHSVFHGSHLFTVNANGSGCNSGAAGCLHDTLITTRPHNPNMFDLADGVLTAAPAAPPQAPPATPVTPAIPDGSPGHR